MAIDEISNDQKKMKALDDWYLDDKKDYDLFAAKYPTVKSKEIKLKQWTNGVKEWMSMQFAAKYPTVKSKEIKLKQWTNGVKEWMSMQHRLFL